MTNPVDKTGVIQSKKPNKIISSQTGNNSCITCHRNDKEVLSAENSAAFIPGRPLPVKKSYVNQPVDTSKLPDEFVNVESEYRKRTGKPVIDGSEDISTYDLLTNHLQPYDIMDSKYRTHKEKDLMAAVQKEASENKVTGKKMTPTDLYRLSLDINEGNRFKALLTVQDALKMTGRSMEVGTAFEGNDVHIKDMVGEEFFNAYVKAHGGQYKPEMGDKMGEEFLSRNFAPIGPALDFTGKYYHLFGTATAATSGMIGDMATYGHASLVNFASVKGDFDRVYGTKETKNSIARTVKDVGSSMSAVLTGGFFWGRYTTEQQDKWEADKTGLNIANRLNDS